MVRYNYPSCEDILFKNQMGYKITFFKNKEPEINFLNTFFCIIKFFTHTKQV